MNILIDTVSPVNNYISYNKFSFIDIPAISLYNNIFLNCTENLYFLVLVIFNCTTYSEINHYQHTGAHLVHFQHLSLFFMSPIELINIIYQYITEFNKTHRLNYLNKIDIINTDTLDIKSKKYSVI